MLYIISFLRRKCIFGGNEKRGMGVKSLSPFALPDANEMSTRREGS